MVSTFSGVVESSALAVEHLAQFDSPRCEEGVELRALTIWEAAKRGQLLGKFRSERGDVEECPPTAVAESNACSPVIVCSMEWAED